jgi:D-lactate dehydrogenase (cytochrome)
VAADPLEGFRDILGADHVVTAAAQRQLLSQDVYRAGTVPLAVLRPDSTAAVAGLVRHARAEDIALFVRGGGMSYTDAYLPDRERAAIVDLGRMDRIRAIEAPDLHATAEAGCTWAAFDAAVAPHGLRARFWGPMSGSRATLGGGMSQGAATFGSGIHGTSASAALAFEVVLGDGSVLSTGTAGAPHHAPFFRAYGPDLTGLFTGDAGALGIKTAVSLQLEPRPGAKGSASFAFGSFEAMRAAVSEVSRHGLATEVFGVETALARLAAGEAALMTDLRALWAVARAQPGPLAALRQAARIALAGRRFLADSTYIANFLCEAADAPRLALTLAQLRRIVRARGTEVANTMAAVVQSTPFPAPMVLGPGGRRLLPLHVILPHSRVDAFHAAFDALRQREAARMAEHRALAFVVFAGVGPSALLYEPVIYWEDEWPELHRATMPPELLALMQPGAANPAGRAYVEALRVEIIELMLAHGGAHLQIGRAYPFLRERPAPFSSMIHSLKQATDPGNLINPGALGLGAAAAGTDANS